MRRNLQRPRSDAGSALLLALLAMVFLTVIGLSLAVVTETEMLIGTNEQIAQETFFAAEAGVATAVSQLLVTNDLVSRYFAIEAHQGDAVRNVGDRTLGYSVDFTDVYPVAYDVAPYTGANEGSTEPHYTGFFYTRVRARRMAWPDTDDVPDCQSEIDRDPDDPPVHDYFENVQAEKVLTLGFFVSPLPDLGGQALWDSFAKPDVFGCAPDKAEADYIQTIP